MYAMVVTCPVCQSPMGSLNVLQDSAENALLMSVTADVSQAVMWPYTISAMAGARHQAFVTFPKSASVRMSLEPPRVPMPHMAAALQGWTTSARAAATRKGAGVGMAAIKRVRACVRVCDGGGGGGGVSAMCGKHWTRLGDGGGEGAGCWVLR